MNSNCPCCNNVVNQTAMYEDTKHKPQPGHYALCDYCATILIFNEDMSFREADLNDVLRLGAKGVHKVGEMQEFIRANRK